MGGPFLVPLKQLLAEVVRDVHSLFGDFIQLVFQFMFLPYHFLSSFISFPL